MSNFNGMTPLFTKSLPTNIRAFANRAGANSSTARVILGDARQHDWRTVGEFGHQRQVPAHCLDRLPQRGQQQIAALLKPRDAVLRDPKLLRHAHLRQLAGLAKLAQGHFLGTVMHFGLGLIGFPIGYIIVAYRYFPGPYLLRGAVWGILLWLAAMVVVVPLAGLPIFFGFGKPMIAALVAHVVYGIILAAIVGKPE